MVYRAVRAFLFYALRHKLRCVGMFACTLSSCPALAATIAPPANAVDVSAVSTAALPDKADPLFRSLFDGWKKMDAVPTGGLASVPSQKPLIVFHYTSPFGVRIDPFNHTASMHPGLDMAAPTGTPVYATADGTISRAERAGGYGNLVQIEHGKSLETRYGHLSQILVHDGQHVHCGDLIALVGSTGRSTGSHLHYEVRIGGHPVNPMPFLQTADYMMALENRTPLPADPQRAMGGPEDPSGD
jgi:murein DD-endopeptidase MepM/ murein hydrolase activator NlpD